MESGPDNRSRLKHHVRAAKEWLGRAEDSLNRSEDVRGDLNLMLARAELARAQETETPDGSVVWARRILPFAAAFLIAGGSWLLWRPPAKEMPPSQPAVTMRTVLPAAQPHFETAETEAPRGTVGAPVLPVIPTEAKAEDDAPPGAAIIPEEASSYGGAEESEAQPETIPAADTSPPSPTARVPSEEMQRLMNSAGQSLRAR